MADFEFQDSITPIEIPVDIAWRKQVWAVFDANKDKRIKIKWGWFRPSFKVGILEPLIVQLVGPRPI